MFCFLSKRPWSCGLPYCRDDVICNAQHTTPGRQRGGRCQLRTGISHQRDTKADRPVMRNRVFLQQVEVKLLPFQVFNDSVIPFSMTVFFRKKLSVTITLQRKKALCGSAEMGTQEFFLVVRKHILFLCICLQDCESNFPSFYILWNSMTGVELQSRGIGLKSLWPHQPPLKRHPFFSQSDTITPHWTWLPKGLSLYRFTDVLNH